MFNPSKQKKMVRPSQFAEQCLVVDTGKPPDFKSRAYLLPILNQDHKRVVLMTSRQSGKSTLVMIKLVTEATLIQENRILFVTAEEKHMHVFRNDRLIVQFCESRPLSGLLRNRKTINNQNQLTLANGSRILIRAIANNPLAVRGISAYRLFIDEEQAIPEKSVILAVETLSAYSDRAKIMHCGTAGSLLNSFTERYQNSTQQEWIIRCNQCGKDNEPLGLDHLDVKRPYLFCNHCGKQMSPAHGRWISRNPPGDYAGYRICRLMEPTARWHTEAKTGILDIMKTYSEDQFKREVLAIPSGKNDAAFVWEEVIACCGEYPLSNPDDPQPDLEAAQIIASADWAYNHQEGGNAFNLFTIWQIDTNRNIKLLFAKRQIGPQYSKWETGLDELIHVFKRFHVKVIGVDHNLGVIQQQELQKSFKCTWPILYAGQTSGTVWNAQNKAYQVNRTKSLDRLLSRIRRKQIQFPRLTNCRHFLTDFNNVGVEFNPETDRKRYTKQGPDDFVHCANYAMILADLISDDIWRQIFWEHPY